MRITHLLLVCLYWTLTSPLQLHAETASRLDSTFCGSQPLAVTLRPSHRELCSVGLLGELNQNLHDEALELKEFLESRKQSTLSGRDRVEACSRWFAMNSYARFMAKYCQNTNASDSANTMVEHLKSDLEGNTDCWTSSNPVLANMLSGVRIVISRAMRIGDVLLQSDK